ncbi:MAG: type II toxin-antitoxin system Phd/YefM family antitoxin [Dehalococcoidia bacterium]
MKTVGVYEAKTHFAKLLHDVERGECVTITRHGKPIARLEPVGDDQQSRTDAIEAMREFAAQHRGAFKGLSIRELIEEGRRY